MNISEKAAYLKGLISGMEYDVNTKEGKLFAGIIDLLEDISLSVLDLEDETATLGEYVEELDHDLGELEEDCYNCDCCGDFEELKCPACGESIYLDPDAIPEDHLIVCPSCNREIEVKVEEAE